MKFSSYGLYFSGLDKNWCSLINCFEVEIQKPSIPVVQANTWSSYKKCYTVKYLVSSTPTGFINFISEAYGGCISDKNIVEQIKYLDVLPNNCAVMPNKGFKHVATLLLSKGCQLIRWTCDKENKSFSFSRCMVA